MSFNLLQTINGVTYAQATVSVFTTAFIQSIALALGISTGAVAVTNTAGGTRRLLDESVEGGLL